MRTTLAIADDILRDLRALARSRSISLTKAANSVLRVGLAREHDATRRNPPYREEVVDLGVPKLDLDRALLIAAGLEDEGTLRKLQEHK